MQEYLTNYSDYQMGRKEPIGVNKTKSMTMCTTRRKRQMKPLYLICRNVQIEEVTKAKLLEIKIQNNRTWTAHIADLSKR